MREYQRIYRQSGLTMIAIHPCGGRTLGYHHIFLFFVFCTSTKEVNRREDSTSCYFAITHGVQLYFLGVFAFLALQTITCYVWYLFSPKHITRAFICGKSHLCSVHQTIQGYVNSPSTCDWWNLSCCYSIFTDVKKRPDSLFQPLWPTNIT